ncbi:hypothetical protein V6Z11_A02G187000 [Gossypium hirsutum]
MSKLSFIEFKYGSLKRPTDQLNSINKTRQSSWNMSSYQPNMEEMKWVFNKFDTNKDGKISKQEYKSAMKIMGKGITDTEMVKAFTTVDTDGDGFIDYKEFIHMMHNMEEGFNNNDIKTSFRVYDLNGDGKISAEELMAVMKKIGERCT